MAHTALPRIVSRPARYVLTTLRDFIYPPLCVLCDNERSRHDDWFCDLCIEKLQRNLSQRDACPRCGQNRNRHVCTCNLVWDLPFERVYSLFDYDDTIQSIARNIKYHGRKALAYHVGRRFARAIPADFFNGTDGFAAIPLHFFRAMERGYNQAEYFARGVIAGLDTPLPYLGSAIRRTRHTKTQTKLNKEQRQKNLKGAFAVDEKRAGLVKGKRLVLVDDVVTTGATTAACAEVLIKAGAMSVKVLSLARD